MDFSGAVWRKSSRSGGGGSEGGCVELAIAGAAVGVRDSKNRDKAHLVFAEATWRRFIGAAAAD